MKIESRNMFRFFIIFVIFLFAFYFCFDNVRIYKNTYIKTSLFHEYALKVKVVIYRTKIDFLICKKENKKDLWMEIYVPYHGVAKTYEAGNIKWNVGTLQEYYMNTMLIRYDGLYCTNDGYLAVAMGSYFGKIGSRFRITLSSGNVIHVIKTDEKADIHTIDGMVGINNYDILEFIIVPDMAMDYYGSTNGYVANGNFNNISEFNGVITKIESLVEE